MLLYQALTGTNWEALRNTGKKCKQKDRKRQRRKEKAGRLQPKLHTPEGHRRCTTTAAGTSSRLVPVQEALHIWLHCFSQLHHRWPRPLHVSMVRFLALFRSFRLCGLLPSNCPDVPRLPRLAESKGSSFANLPTVLVQLFYLLILYLFCLFLRQVCCFFFNSFK